MVSLSPTSTSGTKQYLSNRKVLKKINAGLPLKPKLRCMAWEEQHKQEL